MGRQRRRLEGESERNAEGQRKRWENGESKSGVERGEKGWEKGKILISVCRNRRTKKRIACVWHDNHQLTVINRGRRLARWGGVIEGWRTMEKRRMEKPTNKNAINGTTTFSPFPGYWCNKVIHFILLTA